MRASEAVQRQALVSYLQTVQTAFREVDDALVNVEKSRAQLVAEGRENPRVVTILCDTGFRYLSTLYNADWLRSKDLPVFEWLEDGD